MSTRAWGIVVSTIVLSLAGGCGEPSSTTEIGCRPVVMRGRFVRMLMIIDVFGRHVVRHLGVARQ